MTRIIHAELVRLVRRRTIAVLVAATLLFAVVATLTVFADSELRSCRRRCRPGEGPPLAALDGPGGGTEAFAVGASFVGFLVFVTFIALIATEFSGGTFRALLLRDPHRLRVIVGKVAGVLVVAAGVVALVEVLTFVVSWLVAPAKGVATAEWFSSPALGAAIGNYAHRPRRRRRLGHLRHHPGRDLPLGAARARRRLRLGRPVREHRRRLVEHGLPVLPRPGAGVAHPGRHRRARHGPGRRDGHDLRTAAALVALTLVSRRDVTS